MIEFKEKVEKFERLSDIVRQDLDALEPAKLPPDWRDSLVTGTIRFEFLTAQEGLPALEGEVAASIDTVCQRCLEPFQLPLAIDMKILFGGEESTAAQDGFEVWELDQAGIRPQDVVEECLIMALPFAAMHVDSENCRGPEEVQDPDEKTRPFADLRAQMEDKN